MDWKRILYGLGGAALTGVVDYVASGAVVTFKTLGVVIAGAIAGWLGTGKKKEA